MKNILSRIFIFLTIISFSVTTIYAKSLDATGVINAYKQWCASIEIAQGNPQKVVQFYAKHAILLPTLSDKILFNDNGGLNDYFSKLTSYKNIHCVTKKLIVEMNGIDFATSAGFYQFIYTDKEGKSIVIPARFTFVYKKSNNEWLIIQHHSSKLPAGS
jgi:hypothetical protein